jgi:hypothetical protein
MRMRLTDSELSGVLARAEEIQNAAHGDGKMAESVESVVQAAEEIGISRTAVELALREQLGFEREPPEVGSSVFAKSADEHYYIAEVLASDSNSVRVRFSKGGEHTVGLHEFRRCQFVPGEKVVCPWPGWGWWTCTIVSYNADKQKVKVSDGWGQVRSFSVSELRLSPPKKSKGSSRATLAWVLIGVGGLMGGAVGSVLTWLLMR